MARPAKSVKTMSKNLTKEEILVRTEVEDKLRGKADKLKPPTYLTTMQKKVFKFVVAEMEASEVLGNLDVFILERFAIVVDRMRQMEMAINEDKSLEFDKAHRTALNSRASEFQRLCNQLSLSPQSRAKLAIANFDMEKEKKDELLQVLSGGKT